MLKIESKIGLLPASDEKAYSFLSDFNNFTNFIPADKIKKWEVTAGSCSFTIDGIGQIGIKIIEKEPFKLLKYTGDEKCKFGFFLWIQLKQTEPLGTKIKLTIHADINPMLQMVAKKPLQKVIDMLVDHIANYFEKNRET